MFNVRCSCLLLLFLGSSGCQLLGVAAYKLSGPPDVPAKYVLAKTPTLVLVENYRHQTSAAASTDLLAQYLARDLETRRIVPIVALEKLVELRDARPAEYSKMPITAIARQLGASQVLYVQLHNSDVTPVAGGGDAFSGQATASVKVVDAVSGENLWPTDIAEGYVVSVQAQAHSAQAATVADVRRELNLKLTEEISKLFRKWKPENLG